MTRLSAPLTLRELAALMGWPAGRAAIRRLVRVLRQRERALARAGHDVVLLHVDQPRAPARVTLTQLRAHMPELFDTQAEIVAAVRAEQEELREDVADAKERTILLARRLGTVEARVVELERRRAQPGA